MNNTLLIVLGFLVSGLGSTLLTEIASLINKKVVGTPLTGLGAFLISGTVAFLMGALQVLSTGIDVPHSWHDIATITGAVWIASQFFFTAIIKNIDALHVTPDTSTSFPLA